MAMITWLLLSLLTVQTAMGHRDFKDARSTMEEELENWVPKGK